MWWALITIPVIIFQVFLIIVQLAGYTLMGKIGLIVAFVGVVAFTIFALAWLSPLMIVQLVIQTGFFLIMMSIPSP
jgi:hypothetical protein